MSFRTRLTSFFLLIVVVPMLAIGFLVFRLISDSAQGKADARANGLATAAASLYGNERASGGVGAETIAGNAALLTGPGVRTRLTAVATRAGLARVRIHSDRGLFADVGDSTAIAPGVAIVRTPRGALRYTIAASTLTAAEYARELAGPGAGVVVTQGGRVVGSTLSVPTGTAFPRSGTVSISGTHYRAVTQAFPGFGSAPVRVTVLSNVSSTSTSVGTDRAVAAAFIAGFLLLALSFSVLASRALQGQLGRFLHAAKRLGGGDFSASVPIEGRDEFAALGTEFNNMSQELERRLDELSQERTRLRESIRRIGETFASNLDRQALLELALRTTIDAVQAEFGRLSARGQSDDPLVETVRVGSLTGLEHQIYDAERSALGAAGLGEVAADEVSVAAIALSPVEPGGRAHGLITVGRRGRPFTDDDREILRSLASQATLALENVELHFQVRRQAVTDELTGLANHGRFQEVLGGESEQVRRYHYPVGLIMLDIDDFKTINDTYGHPQGDVVLKHVARVLQETSRETDAPARYGGEEMALILPHTDLDGSHAIAERVRSSIEALRVPRLDQQGFLRVTASVGVAANSDGDKEALIADADNALYLAKRQGKNRTIRAEATTANVLGGE